MAHLTNAERDTLNAAMEIILAHTPPKASWIFGANHWHGMLSIGISTYFTSTGAQHTTFDADTFADQIEHGIAIQAEEDANVDIITARRVEALRAELATLTGETA